MIYPGDPGKERCAALFTDSPAPMTHWGIIRR